MIKYYHPENKDVAIHYATILDDSVVQGILTAGQVTTSEEAYALAKFYWAMLDKSVKENDAGIDSFADLDWHQEKLLTAFMIHLGNLGYDAEWEKASDEAND